MSMDPAFPQSLPCLEASDSRVFSPIPVINGPEEMYPPAQMSSAEMPLTETVSPSPSSMDLLIQDSPDSSTSPKVKPSTSVQESTIKKEDSKTQVKKQKIRTVFSQTQLCVLNDRFQKQKYLSLQQMQELSSNLNLSYKQVKTWFQNQRMKCKRWQKNNWPKNSNSVTQGSLPTEYSGPYSNYNQGYQVNSPGNLPPWSNQTWNNPTWSNQTWNSQSWSSQSWNSQSWSNHSWNTQTWYTQSWNNQAWNNQTWNNSFYNYGEESLQPSMQFQQNFPASDLETTLAITGESHRYFSTPQPMDLFLNYSLNRQSENM
ncbi:homeobox protein NANOG isoform X1 [Urocitellus parryii]|uniref:Homeobox protein NANOG n=1 Tax=Urocitellus parryii TaxID=9999 RepID=A0A8D2KJH1_UROPR|nr:homeobox protein NANOG isoform X1 [Urocitellus parryii]